MYELKLNSHECTLYSLLGTGEPKTTSDIAEMMGIDATEVYHLLTSLQTKKIVKAVTGKPMRFIAIKSKVRFI